MHKIKFARGILHTEAAILKIAEALEVPVSSDDTEISHKLNTRGNKAIIAKFISHKAKTSLYSARTKLKQVKLADVFPESSTKSSNWRTLRIGSLQRNILGEGTDSFCLELWLISFPYLQKGLVVLSWVIVGVFVCVVWIVYTIWSFCIFSFVI